MIDPGIYDIPNEQYHASAGLSRSGIMELLKTPRHYQARYIEGFKEKSKSAYEVGTLFHALVLEPHLFEQNFAITTRRRTQKAKDAVGDKELLKSKDYEIAKAMKKAVFSNQDAAALLQNAQIEKSIYWNDPETGILCKCRPDILFISENISYMADLKSVKDASKWAFEKSIHEYGYHIQAASIQEGVFHATGIKIPDEAFFWIVCEKQPPFLNSVYILSSKAMQRGRELFRQGLELYKQCAQTNEWPGYQNGAIADLPAYAYYN